MNYYQKIYRFSHLLIKEPSYIFGRFYFIRKLYSKLQSILQQRKSNRFITIGDQYHDKIKLPFFKTHGAVIFEKNIDESLLDLRKHSFAGGFFLNEEIRQELANHAQNTNLRSSCSLKESGNHFMLKDVQSGKVKDQLVATGTVINSYQLAAVQKIALDESLVQLVSHYLKYRPLFIDVWFFWSFENSLSDDQRREQNQTIDFHYDIHGFNFLYVNFYLTDVTANTGAHVLIKGSHKDKKMKYLMGSSRLSKEEAHSYYDDERVILIEGKSGTGFIEDASCFHKAIPPIESKRLMLQLRYY